MTRTLIVDANTRALFIEPFACLSHLALYNSLLEMFPAWEWTLKTLPDRQWKWRNRVGALQFSQQISPNIDYDILIAGSLINLCELLALSPSLSSAHKVIYFHENQFAYPWNEKPGDSDKQIMYNSVTSALAADVVLFNSEYNRRTFLDGAKSFLKRFPVELNIDSVCDKLQKKSEVFPIPVITEVNPPTDRHNQPTILWNHRWEHDKKPEKFFEALERLQKDGFDFQVIVAGEEFEVNPPVFAEAKQTLGERLIHFGFAPTRVEYEKLLAQSDIVVSTAAQEFYGIAVIEAVANGALPIVPDALSYQELFPAEYRYVDHDDSSAGLRKALARRLRQAADGQLPSPREIAKFAEPYLLGDNHHHWRNRFLQACGLKLSSA